MHYEIILFLYEFNYSMSSDKEQKGKGADG